jgi:predicted HicB family RNase H-like nuclease
MAGASDKDFGEDVYDEAQDFNNQSEYDYDDEDDGHSMPTSRKGLSDEMEKFLYERNMGSRKGNEVYDDYDLDYEKFADEDYQELQQQKISNLSKQTPFSQNQYSSTTSKKSSSPKKPTLGSKTVKKASKSFSSKSTINSKSKRPLNE